MKKIINLSILLAVILTLSSCNAFKGWFGKSGPDILITAGTPYASSCTVSDDYVIFRDLTMTTKGKDGYITGYTIGVQLSTDASFPKGSTIEAETTDIAYPENFISSSGTYRGSVKVEGLTKGTKYSYRTYAQYKGKTVYGSTQALTTYTNLATSVSVDRDRLALRVRQGEYVSVSVFPEDAQDRNDLVWESSDESVAVVRFGSINAVGVGSCTVTVSTTKGHTASLRVDVRKVDVTGIDFPNGAVHLGVGTLGQTSELGSADLSGAARILPDSASFLGVKYSVVDEGIARIGSDGKLVGVKEGHTYIEFMSEDNPSVVGRCDVCVHDLREDEGQHVVDMGLSVDWGSEYLTYDHPVYGLTKYFGWGSIEFSNEMEEYDSEYNKPIMAEYEALYALIQEMYTKETGNPVYDTTELFYKYQHWLYDEHPELVAQLEAVEAKEFDRKDGEFYHDLTNFKTLTDESDQATLVLGKPWRIPEAEEIEELLSLDKKDVKISGKQHRLYFGKAPSYGVIAIDKTENEWLPSYLSVYVRTRTVFEEQGMKYSPTYSLITGACVNITGETWYDNVVPTGRFARMFPCREK